MYIDSANNIYVLVKRNNILEIEIFNKNLIKKETYHAGEVPKGSITSLYFNEKNMFFLILLHHKNAILKIYKNCTKKIYQNDTGVLHYFTSDGVYLYITVIGIKKCQIQKLLLNGELVCIYELDEIENPSGIFYSKFENRLLIIERNKSEVCSILME